MLKRKLWMCADIELEMESDELLKHAIDRMCITLESVGVNLAAWSNSKIVEYNEIDRDTVIKALEICATNKSCDKCPMNDECKGTANAAMAAAIELLKRDREEERHGNMF